MSTRAFTLIETLVTVAITALIWMVLTSLITYFYRTNSYTLQQSMAVGIAREGVQNAVRSLREASYGNDGTYPIKSVATSSIEFYANTNADSIIERVTYALINGTFYKTVTAPIGNPLTYVGASIATSTISTNVTNGTSTPIFRYFDNTGTELAPPVDISAIASIKTTVVVDIDAQRSPVSFTLSGAATLRNLRN
jgi:type II secretory pathway pseudopilin PulG